MDLSFETLEPTINAQTPLSIWAITSLSRAPFRLTHSNIMRDPQVKVFRTVEAEKVKRLVVVLNSFEAISLIYFTGSIKQRASLLYVLLDRTRLSVSFTHNQCTIAYTRKTARSTQTAPSMPMILSLSVRLKLIIPPYTASSVQYHLCNIEGFPSKTTSTLFKSLFQALFSQVADNDSTRLSIRGNSGLGSSEDEP